MTNYKKVMKKLVEIEKNNPHPSFKFYFYEEWKNLNK